MKLSEDPQGSVYDPYLAARMQMMRRQPKMQLITKVAIVAALTLNIQSRVIT